MMTNDAASRSDAAKSLWGGRFTSAADAGFARFNASFNFDRRLFLADMAASRAHAEGLRDAGVLSDEEAALIDDGLQRMLNDFAARGTACFDELPSEDVHSFIEARLIWMIGDTGRKLHTGRSRNDQVATALRLFMREATNETINHINFLQQAVLNLAARYASCVLPGYTHMQRAQPVLFAHWCLAYFEMLARDVERFTELQARINILPLGAAALAGTSYTIDRERVAARLGFANVARNSLDAVSDRDFLVEYASAAALVHVHLSRLAEDIILYATTEFGFIELSDAVATGSSLMPQKKNPDAMELVRGKAGRVFGKLQALLVMMKGLPLAYNKDLQEDKEAIFDVVDTVHASLAVSATVLENTHIRADSTLR